MKQKILNIVINLTITIVAIIVYHTFFLNEVKLAYVKTGVLFNDYKAMIEANEQFNKELQVAQASMDTLKRKYEQLREQEATIEPEKKSDWSYQLGIAEYEYKNYSTTAQQKMQERQQELTTAVVNEINSFIQDYGNKNGYTIIFGATNEGNILYGEEQEDLTEIILEKLNEQYQ